MYGSITMKLLLVDTSCVYSKFSLREVKLGLDGAKFEITCDDEDVMSAYIEVCKLPEKLGL